MGFLDRFRSQKQPSEPDTDPEPWDGSDVGWAAAGVPDDRIEMATPG